MQARIKMSGTSRNTHGELVMHSQPACNQAMLIACCCGWGKEAQLTQMLTPRAAQSVYSPDAIVKLGMLGP